MLKNSRILCIVAHPDDEILGLGASLHRLIHEAGCNARAVILGEGVTSRDGKRDVNLRSSEIDRLRLNIEDARKIIGYESVGIYDFPDNRFDSVNMLDIIKVVEKEKRDFSPQYIFTHHGGDLNVDHQRTFEAVITATRPMEAESVEGIFCFETPSSTEWSASSDPFVFRPNFFQEVKSLDIKKKIEAMEGYENEKRTYPHPRSPEALKLLAQRYGVILGVKYAEAFQIIRMINRVQ